jgi:energy-coupling factor transport system ATP-binding protein
MEDVAEYAERLIVINDGKIAFDDTPKKVFAHYKELEKMGLAAPQITYLMHELKERGLDVDTSAVTVSEAKRSIEKALRERKKNRRS